MSEMQTPHWTAAEQALSDAWDEHQRCEFAEHNPEATLATMVDVPRVHEVPVMIGGEGKEQVYEFYARHFLPNIPPDISVTLVSRTIGQGRLVDEMVISFTHTVQMDWMLPGVAPTGKRVDMALVAVVQFAGNKLVHERLYWDQASILVQLGLLDPQRLPVVGPDAAHAVLDRGVALNRLLTKSGAQKS